LTYRPPLCNSTIHLKQYQNKINIELCVFIFQWIPSFYLLLSSIYLWRLLGPKPIVYLLMQPLVFFLIHFFGSSVIVWICAIGFLCSGSHWAMIAAKAFLMEGQVNLINHDLF
jgi:hypothetical protein